MRPKGEMRKLIFIVPCLLLFSTAEAAYLDLAWSPNEESDIDGYRVYYATSPGDYINYVDVGNRTSYRLGDLIDDAIYYIALTAYDRASNESGFSGEVTGVGLPEEDADPPGEKAGASIGSGGDDDDHSGCFARTLLSMSSAY